MTDLLIEVMFWVMSFVVGLEVGRCTWRVYEREKKDKEKRDQEKKWKL